MSAWLDDRISAVAVDPAQVQRMIDERLACLLAERREQERMEWATARRALLNIVSTLDKKYGMEAKAPR